MSVTQTEEKRGRGRPKKETAGPVKKIKLKHSPKTAYEDYYKKYGYLGFVAIYGIDKFTEELIRYCWKHPDMTIIATDPIPEKLRAINQEIGNLPWSLHRWEVVTSNGFLEAGYYPVVVTTKEYYEMVSKLDNPENVEVVLLEEV